MQQQKQGSGSGKQKHRKNFHKQQSRRSKIESDEIAAIERAVAEQAPPRGSAPAALPAAPAAAEGQQQQPQKQQQPAGTTVGLAAAKRFDELPISEYSKLGLRDAKYVSLTAVQRAALPHALCGRDVLGAAKTGSGKTLAFLLPVIEKLFRQRWGKLDGLGALVISPTRELALQIFDELRKIGRRHDLSAGLLIGGKDVKEEQERVHGMNILVCTPGRLLQHMDETPGFDASQLQVLVLDEADRILDMGFSVTLNAIVANIPRDRQTLLFSATQTKSVKDLARLSLKDPEYIAVHAEASNPTPLKLQQAYMVCELQEKLDILWSFIKTHLKAKTIVFVSTCKQVRFLFEAFRKLRPGVPLRALHGKMNQYKRMGVFYEFCEAKAMVLFATDIAARGLDFPTIDWVVQADCPEDVAAYIHRVGRTARYVSSGKGLLLLTPNEKEGMLQQLEEAKVPMKQLKHNPSKVQPVTPALQALLSKDTELKEVAQRALVSYLRSVFLQPNRKVFDVAQLPAAEYAYSMGLPNAPKLRFLKKSGKKMQEVVVGGAPAGEDELGPAEPTAAAAAGADARRQQQQAEGPPAAQQAQQRRKAAVESGEGEQEQQQQQDEGEAAAATPEAAADGDDDFLVVKRRNIYENDASGGGSGRGGGASTQAEAEAAERRKQDLNGEEVVGVDVGSSKKKKKLRISASRVSGTRVVFDEEGGAMDPLELLARDGTQFGQQGHEATDGLDAGIHASMADRAAAARAMMLQRDRQDKEELREMRKEKRQEKRSKRLAREHEERDTGPAMLAGASSADEDASDHSGRGDGSSSEDEQGQGRGGQQSGGGRAAAASAEVDSDLDLDLLESSDEEVERQPEVSHFGMLPAVQQRKQQQPPPAGRGSKRGATAGAAAAADEAGDSDGSDGGHPAAEAAGTSGRQQERQQQKKRRTGAAAAAAAGAAGMSLAQQQALALRLMGAKR